jgi:hypothetical protein
MVSAAFKANFIMVAVLPFRRGLPETPKIFTFSFDILITPLYVINFS